MGVYPHKIICSPTCWTRWFYAQGIRQQGGKKRLLGRYWCFRNYGRQKSCQRCWCLNPTNLEIHYLRCQTTCVDVIILRLLQGERVSCIIQMHPLWGRVFKNGGERWEGQSQRKLKSQKQKLGWCVAALENKGLMNQGTQALKAGTGKETASLQPPKDLLCCTVVQHCQHPDFSPVRLNGLLTNRTVI